MVNIKIVQIIQVCECAMDSFCSEYGAVADYNPSGHINVEDFSPHLKDYWLLKVHTTTWSYIRAFCRRGIYKNGLTCSKIIVQVLLKKNDKNIHTH
jgi:hypothetical protein